MGMEIIWYFSPKITGKRNKAKPYIYFYGGGCSVCVLALFGYSNFKSYKSYLRYFDEAYASVWHI